MKSIIFLILGFLLLSGCTYKNKHIGGKGSGFDQGKEVVDSLDILFKRLSDVTDSPANYLEKISINEIIRQTIEQITKPKSLKEIGDYYSQKEHEFRFTLSNDGKFGVFSWKSRLELFNIKNVALFVKNGKVIPTSLYGNPIIYSSLYSINGNHDNPRYILTGMQEINDSVLRYRIHAYDIGQNGLEEVIVFPDYKCSIEYSYVDKDLLKNQLGFKIESNGKQIKIPKTIDSSITYNTYKYDGRKYILEKF